MGSDDRAALIVALVVLSLFAGALVLVLAWLMY